MADKQEEKLRKLAKELFLNEYPNPERKGCPDSQTIEAVAFGKLGGEQASPAAGKIKRRRSLVPQPRERPRALSDRD